MAVAAGVAVGQGRRHRGAHRRPGCWAARRGEPPELVPELKPVPVPVPPATVVSLWQAAVPGVPVIGGPMDFRP